MDHIGIDVHKKERQIYVLAESGEIIEGRLRTEGERFAAVLGTRPRPGFVRQYRRSPQGQPGPPRRPPCGLPS